jgi:uncharacterized UPF0160 family protein
MNSLKKFFQKRKILVTHDGSFHADDIFACATLFLVLEKKNEKGKVCRTRNEEKIKKADYVFDVGGIYDPEKNRFDHHQKGGAGIREKNEVPIPYSSFGLVWKKYGEFLCVSKEAALEIEKKIVIPVDAKDNGIDLNKPFFDGIEPYSADKIFLAFSPTFLEKDKNIDKIFKQEVKKIISLLKREIEIAQADFLGKKSIKDSYYKSEDKRIIFLEQDFPRYLIQNVLPNFPEPIYFIYPSTHSSFWKVEAVRENLNTMKSRKLFPESWRGLMHGDPKLKELTNVDGFDFCHSSGFFLTISTKEGAMKLAELALNNY